MKRNLYRVTVFSQYLVLADNEDDAKAVYIEIGGDLEDSYIESVTFIEEVDD